MKTYEVITRQIIDCHKKGADAEEDAWEAMLTLAAHFGLLDTEPVSEEEDKADEFRAELDRYIDGNRKTYPNFFGRGTVVTVRTNRDDVPLKCFARHFDEEETSSYLLGFMHYAFAAFLYADQTKPYHLAELRDRFNYAASNLLILTASRKMFERMEDKNEITYTASPVELFVLQNDMLQYKHHGGITVIPVKPSEIYF